MEKLIVFAAVAVCSVFITALVCLLLYWAADFIRMLADRPGNMPQILWAVIAVIVFLLSMLILQKYGFQIYDALKELIGKLPFISD